MWRSLAAFILKFRIPVLIVLAAATAFMGYHASKASVSYEFTKAIPTDNIKYQEYQQFLKTFGEDGGTLVIGLQRQDFFEPGFFQRYSELVQQIRAVKGVTTILSIPTAVTMEMDTLGKMQVYPVWRPSHEGVAAQETFLNLPFYRGFLYNPDSGSYLMAVGISKEVLNSKERLRVIPEIQNLAAAFGEKEKVVMRYSGLPLIRTVMATKVQQEMKLFIVLSFALTGLILFLFFRSLVAVLVSMLVVAIGVVWSLGTIVLAGYQLTLLTGLIPPLIVVIGIPNCVYFINKYHSEFAAAGQKKPALLQMVNRMGIVTLFTNLTAAIGFGVFFFTRSVLLKEFGLVAGLNLIAIFLISLFLIPALLSLLPPPGARHTRYLESRWMQRMLDRLSRWTLHHRPWIYGVSLLASLFGVLGLTQLRVETHIVDDLPKSDQVYRDLQFFETNFGGVMPLEIVIDAKKKYGATLPRTLRKTDSLAQYLHTVPGIGRVLAVTEPIKFAAQAMAGGVSSAYQLPDETGLKLAGPILRGKTQFADTGKAAVFNKLLNSFMDSSRSTERISVSMADVGSRRLPAMLDSIQKQTAQIFPQEDYKATFTGTSVVFLEGNYFIINSLRDSLILAFLMIFGCMVLLFRSWKMVLVSFIVNVVPLAITAGLMGWLGVPLKPSTVLVFSVALGITIDVTIRFLVTYRQDRDLFPGDVTGAVRHTLHETGQSIIYTSLILAAGFGVFCLSSFGGTKSLGYLTSFTLLVAMITNLTLQPALLTWLFGNRREKKS